MAETRFGDQSSSSSPCGVACVDRSAESWRRRSLETPARRQSAGPDSRHSSPTALVQVGTWNTRTRSFRYDTDRRCPPSPATVSVVYCRESPEAESSGS